MHAIPATACGCTTRQRSWNPTLGCHEEDEPASAPWPRTRTLYAEPVLCNLHAAAPHMLEALEDVLPHLCEMLAIDLKADIYIGSVKAAIAKATGA
jgi:hypothetical protein